MYNFKRLISKLQNLGKFNFSYGFFMINVKWKLSSCVQTGLHLQQHLAIWTSGRNKQPPHRTLWWALFWIHVQLTDFLPDSPVYRLLPLKVFSEGHSELLHCVGEGQSKPSVPSAWTMTETENSAVSSELARPSPPSPPPGAVRTSRVQWLKHTILCIHLIITEKIPLLVDQYDKWINQKMALKVCNHILKQGDVVFNVWTCMSEGNGEATKSGQRTCVWKRREL